jgi:hypothetical protein
MRNRTGIPGQSPLGTDEVIYSDVTKTESWRGCGWGHGRVSGGEFVSPLTKNPKDTGKFFQVFFLTFPEKNGRAWHFFPGNPALEKFPEKFNPSNQTAKKIKTVIGCKTR